ncbi:DoxX family protein [Emcibacter sp. SYSU 3D8]|uniref:DoxX family protein n=1 Tax=Emcibacter sp. SYSU 3D8 TaxID=3133969 RepID=UPI0031FF2035
MAVSFDRYSPYALAALRIVAAALFVSHGLVKLFGFPDGAAPGVQPLASMLGAAAVIEVGGGLLVLIGLMTRPAAFLLSGQMAFAYFIAHAPAGFHPLLNGGEAAILFCFIFLYIAAAGPGAFSVDRRR